MARYQTSCVLGKPASKPSSEIYSRIFTAHGNDNGGLWTASSVSELSPIIDSMYTGTDSVSTHLMYAAEYHATMRWLTDSGAVSEFEETDLASWGNFTDSQFYHNGILKESGVSELVETGAITQPSNRHKKNNIYDIVGNVGQIMYNIHTNGNYLYTVGFWWSYGGSKYDMFASDLTPGLHSSRVGSRITFYIK